MVVSQSRHTDSCSQIICVYDSMHLSIDARYAKAFLIIRRCDDNLITIGGTKPQSIFQC